MDRARDASSLGIPFKLGTMWRCVRVDDDDYDHDDDDDDGDDDDNDDDDNDDNVDDDDVDFPPYQTVSHLVSTWPKPELDVHRVLPPEDLSRCQQLTTPFDTAQPGGMSLLDSFMVGLLNLKPHSKLRDINFAGFKHGQ